MATNYGVLVRPAQMDLRDNIRDLAKRNGWTFVTLARNAGMKYAHLTQAMSANRWFTEDEVTDLADALEVAVDELMGESVFKTASRGSKFDLPRPWEIKEDVGSGAGRALCCECGTFRRYTVAEIDPRTHIHHGTDPAGRRMVADLKCRTCDRITRHAEIRGGTGAAASYDEEEMRAPTREQEAMARRDSLVQRLAGFNVDVHFRARRKEKERAEGYTTCYSFDESKDRWRVEIDPNAPARVQSVALLSAWRAIAMDDHNVDWDPRKGVVSAQNEAVWEAAVDDLVADIARFLPLERQRLRVSVTDEVAREDVEAGR